MTFFMGEIQTTQKKSMQLGENFPMQILQFSHTQCQLLKVQVRVTQ